MFAFYERLNMHVYASNREVIKAASRKLKRSARYSREYREARHVFYTGILKHHAAARSLVQEWRL